MNIRQQLKKLEVRDKKGKVKGYRGKPKFFSNPTTPGYSGTEKKEKKDKNGRPVEYMVHRIDKKAKERETIKQIKKQMKDNKKLQKVKERIHEKDIDEN